MGNGDRFVYVTFIRTSPEKLWAALTKPEFTRQYWFGTSLDSTWDRGSSWQLKTADGRVTDGGKVVEVDKPRRLVLSWKHELMADMRDDENVGATHFLLAIPEQRFQSLEKDAIVLLPMALRENRIF